MSYSAHLWAIYGFRFCRKQHEMQKERGFVVLVPSKVGDQLKGLGVM
jgi:hypothetical protein